MCLRRDADPDAQTHYPDRAFDIDAGYIDLHRVNQAVHLSNLSAHPRVLVSDSFPLLLQSATQSIRCSAAGSSLTSQRCDNLPTQASRLYTDQTVVSQTSSGGLDHSGRLNIDKLGATSAQRTDVVRLPSQLLSNSSPNPCPSPARTRKNLGEPRAVLARRQHPRPRRSL